MGFLDKLKKNKEQEMESSVVSKVDELKEKVDKPESSKETKPEKEKKAKKEPKEKKTKKEVVKKEKVSTKSAKVVRATLSKSILSPVITEKATYLAAQNKYVFRVDPNATRVEIKIAFRELYGVLPEKVNIVRMRGNRVRFGRIRGKQSSWKKAIITVPKGKEIQVYEGV